MQQETRNTRFRLEALLRPRSVVLVGPPGRILENLRTAGFSGPLDHLESHAQIARQQTPYDLAILDLPPLETPLALAELARLGTFAAVVPGPCDGLSTQRTGVRCLGANSFGLAIPKLGLNATGSHLPPPPGRVALVSQSASLCRAVIDWAGPNGVGFSHVVGIGRNDDIGFSQILDWLSRDPDTGAILLDINNIRDSRRFLSAARAAARLRPVVAIHPGGRLADPAGNQQAAFEAALRRCGVLSVQRLEDLLAAAETLTRARPSRGESLAIVTNAATPARLAADAALRDGLQLADLKPETQAVLTLSGAQPGRGGIVQVETTRLADTAALLAGAREVSSILLVHAPTGPADAATMQAIAAAAHGIHVPLLACIMGETTGAPHRRHLADVGVPCFATPEHALRGFFHLVQDRRNRAAARELPANTVLDLHPDLNTARQIIDAALSAGKTSLPSEQILAAYGLADEPLTVTTDPTFGPIIHFASAIDLPPLNLPLARALIARSTQPDAPHADALVRLSQLLIDLPDVAALDAETLTLGPPRRLAIPPYPSELAGQFVAGTETLTIRPIRPEDAAAHTALFQRLPPEDIRWRFFSAVRELSAEQTARLTQIDYEREMAFVAVREATGETVGAARLVRDGDSGEFAVLVEPAMKGHGLGRHLMSRLAAWARSQGITTIIGQVLADNRSMLGFIRRLGFTVTRVVGEPDLTEARMNLGESTL